MEPFDITELCIQQSISACQLLGNVSVLSSVVNNENCVLSSFHDITNFFTENGIFSFNQCKLYQNKLLRKENKEIRDFFMMFNKPSNTLDPPKIRKDG